MSKLKDKMNQISIDKLAMVWSYPVDMTKLVVSFMRRYSKQNFTRSQLIDEIHRTIKETPSTLLNIFEYALSRYEEGFTSGCQMFIDDKFFKIIREMSRRGFSAAKAGQMLARKVKEFS